MRGELGKYIATQHLRRLRYPELDALPVFDYIDALGEHPHSKRKFGYAEPTIPGEDELWPLVSNRNLFLADQSIRRLCVTVEGGVGKTKLLEELEATVAYDHPGQVVLRMDLRHLPTEADHFLESGPRVLARRAWTELKSHRNAFAVHGLPFPESEGRDEADVIPDQIISIVQRAARTGDLCLIVDAFDQLDKQAAWDRVQALSDFISHKYCPKIRCIIAGRPYAIKRVWDALQLGELRSLEVQVNGKTVQIQQPVWEFCKLQKFAVDQVKEYLSGVSAQDGADKLADLKRMDAEEIHLPRTLNIIRELTAGELREMQTAADLYWHAMNKTIIDNFRRARTEYQLQYLRVEHVRPIVAAVAFAMMIWKDEPVVEVPSIQTDKARDFFRFMKRAGLIAVLKDEGIEFHEALLDLAQVDSESIQFHFYSESPTREAPAEICDIRMSDATIRDFFAAHWAARYLKPQIEWLESQKMVSGLPAIDLELRLRDNVNSDDFKRFWQLLVGMPNEAPVTHEEAAIEESWTSAVSPLFEVRESRPTELMYRCWPDLLWRAGFMEYRDHTERPDWNETPTGIGTLRAQQRVKRLFESCETSEAMSPASRVVFLFLTDYLSQCKAQEQACLEDLRVTSETRAQFHLDCDFTPIDVDRIPLRRNRTEEVRKQRLTYLNQHYPLFLFERSFRVLDGGPFLYGDFQVRPKCILVTEFRLNAYLVSESVFKCFGTLKDRNSDTERTFSASLVATNGLNLQEWLIFAIWCHGRLPDEYQWEAAARGKIGVVDLAEHWQFGFELEEDLSYYACLDGTNKIGQKLPTTNAELYDIHGLLWELCIGVGTTVGQMSPFMLRGGSSVNVADATKCSTRVTFVVTPDYTLVGCRISRRK